MMGMCVREQAFIFADDGRADVVRLMVGRDRLPAQAPPFRAG